MFEILTGYTDYGYYENYNGHFNNNRIKGNEQPMLVILNYTFLHDQNNGVTVPYPYLMLFCKNIYLRILFKRA